MLGVKVNRPPSSSEPFSRFSGRPAAAEDVHDQIAWIGQELDKELRKGPGNMQGLGCREGNDCRDADGNEYELKSVNLLLTKGVFTHHHLNPTILKKYRAVKAWYFSFYEGIELTEMWRVETADIEPWFAKNEQKWHRSGGRDINNPKIPVTFVRQTGKLIYSNKTDEDGTAQLLCRYPDLA